MEGRTLTVSMSLKDNALPGEGYTVKAEIPTFDLMDDDFENVGSVLINLMALSGYAGFSDKRYLCPVVDEDELEAVEEFLCRYRDARNAKAQED